MTLLDVHDLETVFHTRDGTVRAVDGVDFSIKEGETVGLVGESGSGKSVTALSVMGLIQSPGEIVDGSVEFNGRDLLDLPERELQQLRGDDLSMILQHPTKSLNPVFKVGAQITETLRVHGHTTDDPWQRAKELLETVGLPNPEENLHRYPHQYSGGMAQRAMIAIAIANNPQLLIADEATTALDVTIEAQILDLLNELQEELGMSMLFISHDLGVIWEICDRVAVMYMGKIVEVADVDELFTDPKHPYTQGLLECLPEGKDEIHPITGETPSATDLPNGCTFHPRCPHATDACKTAYPATKRNNGQSVACYRYTDKTESGATVTGEQPAPPTHQETVDRGVDHE